MAGCHPGTYGRVQEVDSVIHHANNQVTDRKADQNADGKYIDIHEIPLLKKGSFPDERLLPRGIQQY
jgi:hypothetical protein